MTDALRNSIKLFQFPRMFGIPNISPFCCKLETWLRMTGIRYEVVDAPDPRKGPMSKVHFVDDGGVRLGDTTLIIKHLKKTRGVDPDAWLDERQRDLATRAAHPRGAMPSLRSIRTSSATTAGVTHVLSLILFRL